MKDKPYPISGHACFFPQRDTPYSFYMKDWKAAPLLAPKRVVKRAKKKGKAK